MGFQEISEKVRFHLITYLDKIKGYQSVNMSQIRSQMRSPVRSSRKNTLLESRSIRSWLEKEISKANKYAQPIQMQQTRNTNMLSLGS